MLYVVNAVGEPCHELNNAILEKKKLQVQFHVTETGKT